MSKEPIRYSDYGDVTINSTKVPEKYRHLIDLAKEWSIGDDCIRSEIMEKTSTEDLENLVKEGMPYIDEIFDWTQTFHEGDDPIPDEVVIFEMFGEPVMEAQLILEERNG